MAQLPYTFVPVRQWMGMEDRWLSLGPQSEGTNQVNLVKESILRKTTVAYGLTHLIRHAMYSNSGLISFNINEKCNFDNFFVRVARPSSFLQTQLPSLTLEDIVGIEMLSPLTSLQLFEPSYLRDSSPGSVGMNSGTKGRYIEVEINSLPPQAAANESSDERRICQILGILLYELFSNRHPFPSEISRQVPLSQPPQKKNASSSTGLVASATRSMGAIDLAQNRVPYVPLSDLGLPSSLNLLVTNLLECGWSNRSNYASPSLHSAIKDLHLLILEPYQFLFDSLPTITENGKIRVQPKEHKLYGREKEKSIITDAFCDASKGGSKALLVGGASGCGKTRLVTSLIDRVKVTGGFVVAEKIDPMEEEQPYSAVISAFNALCPVIKNECSAQDLKVVIDKLKDEFVADFPLLVRLLPNVCDLSPQFQRAPLDERNVPQMNIHNVSFILRRFVSVVTSDKNPLMLILDDIQWADNTALDLVRSILADTIVRFSASIFFVGCFRDNEVEDGHPVFHMINHLEAAQVETTRLTLTGLGQNSINEMVADSLRILPRLCADLSDLIFLVARGSPLFTLSLMQSLVDRNLLQYSLRERRWVWDMNVLRSHTLNNNVLGLLSSKINDLPQDYKHAILIASCFGTKISESVIECLDQSHGCPGFRAFMEKAVRDSFMEKIGGNFNFIHDKVREASYKNIPEKDKFHWNLALVLHQSTTMDSATVTTNTMLFTIADQMKNGSVTLQQEHRGAPFDVPTLFFNAGSKAFDRSDFPRAYSYFELSLSLLPDEHWKQNYDLSLRLFLFVAKCSCACGAVDEGKEALQKVLDHAKCLEDKLEAHYLLVTILVDMDQGENAYAMCCEVLSGLGQNIPDSADSDEVAETVRETSQLLQSTTEGTLLGLKRMDDFLRARPIVQFLELAVDVAFFVKPRLIPFLTCRMVQLTVENGVSEYSVVGLLQYAMIIFSSMKAPTDISIVSKAAKVAMSFVTQLDLTKQMARVILFNYGFVSNEPFQACCDMHRRGFEIGMSNGDASFAFKNAQFYIRTSIFAGSNLPKLIKEAEYYTRLASQFKNSYSESFLSMFRDTISVLIDNGQSSAGDNKVSTQANQNIRNFHLAFQSYWLGHHDRCNYYGGKVLETTLTETPKLNRDLVAFYYGLNTFQLLKKNNTSKIRHAGRQAIAAMKSAAEYSKWNFENKYHLLEAEFSSSNSKNKEAEESYAAAIKCSRSSKFVNEEGLSCELAGFHYLRNNKMKKAKKHFNQAKVAYEAWGSQKKVDFVTQQLKKMES